MNAQTFFYLALIAIGIGFALAFLMIMTLIYFVVLGSRLESFRKLLQNLPRLAAALRTLADALDGAARGAEEAGRVAVGGGQALLSAGTVIDALQVPTGSLHTRNLWECGFANPLNLGPLYVLTDVQIGMRPAFAAGNSPVTNAGQNVVAVGHSLGPVPSQPGTISDQLHESSRTLRSLAQFIESLV